jgi:GntR family transcriptional regulator
MLAGEDRLVDIDQNSPIPLYYQLKQNILRQLEGGEIAEGSRLPSETVLASRAGLSRFTVRQALEELQREGWLEKHQGKGTFAARPTVPVSIAWRLVGFSEDMAHKGFRVTSRVIDTRLVTPSKDVARALALRSGRQAVYVQRLRSVNGRPFLVDSVHVRSDLCPGLETVDLTDTSLFRAMEVRYHKTIARAHRTLTIATAEPWVARLLSVPRGAPLYRFMDLLYTTGGEPILYAQTLINQDRCEFVFDLSRSPGAKRDTSLSFTETTNPTPRASAGRTKSGKGSGRRRS